MARVEVSSPFPVFALPRAWAWMQEFRSRVCDDFSPQDLAEFMAQWDAQERNPERVTFAVERDGEIGGLVTVTRLSPVLADIHLIFKREFWGHETTATALRIVLHEVFQRGIRKVTSLAFRDNHALIGLACKLGAVKEGVLREQTMRGGKPVDMVIVGLTAEGFYDRVKRTDWGTEQHGGQQDHNDEQHGVAERDGQHKPQPGAVAIEPDAASHGLRQRADDEPDRNGSAVQGGGSGLREQQLLGVG